ncbi:suppressor of glycerol defect [Saitoella coloradoensis]
MSKYQAKNTTALPKALREELAALAGDGDTKYKKQKTTVAYASRKEQRKQLRLNAKGPRRPPPKASTATASKSPNAPPLKSILKKPVTAPSVQASAPKKQQKEPPKPKEKTKEVVLPKTPLERALEENDEEIAYFEKLLKKKSSDRIGEEDFDMLLEGITTANRGMKRKRDEPAPEEEEEEEEEEEGEEDFDEESGDEDELDGLEEFDDLEGDENEEEDDEGDDSDAGSFLGFEEEDDEQVPQLVETKRTRPDPTKPAIDNPAPAPASAATPAKYIPPSQRRLMGQQSDAKTEELTRLRRVVNGHFNKLSEANMGSIINEFQALYTAHPRHDVNQSITDLVLAIITSRDTLLDTFVILHAGFIAALYRVQGIEFGAFFVQTLVEMYDKHHAAAMQTVSTDGNPSGGQGGKACTNLIVLLTELYNLQVVGCTLIYDFIRVFLGDLNELNTELLLKIVRNSGQQLRSDDPTALKDIVLMMQSSINKMDKDKINTRTKFMIETITNLKNNKLKTANASSQLTAEATSRMKKFLGGLVTYKTAKSVDPLRVTLEDIHNVETKGKWWLVGASWKDDGTAGGKLNQNVAVNAVKDVDESQQATAELLKLAREQRMNTDIRRAIFVTLMSAEDYVDACDKVMKLALKKAQEREIPRVLLHCAGNEKAYNPYYTFIAARLCAQQHGIKMTFQFCLWDFFRSMGEQDMGAEDADDFEQAEDVPLRKVVNLAKLYGQIVAEKAIGISILKTLNFVELQSNTKIFLQIFFCTLILHTQRGALKRKPQAVMDIFAKCRENLTFAQGLEFFLKKHMKKVSVLTDEKEKETVKWGAAIAQDMLSVMTRQT